MNLRNKRPIVLLTDFGNSDAYAGILRGVIYRGFPEALIIDLSHEVPPFQTIQAAYMLKSSIAYFPQGSVFVIVVDPGVGTSRPLLAVQTPTSFFLAPDNGVLEWTLQGSSSYIIRRVAKSLHSAPISATFHGRDILAPWAAELAKNPRSFSKIGPRISKIQSLELPDVTKTNRKLAGEVLFFDHFGNAITNLEKSFWPDDSWEHCKIKAGSIRISSLEKTYGPKSVKMCALINSENHLEIARPSGSARSQLKIKDRVIVESTS